MRASVIIVSLMIETLIHSFQLQLFPLSQKTDLETIQPFYSSDSWSKEQLYDKALDASADFLTHTEILHSPPLFLVEAAAASLFRPLDPAFIFSLPGLVSIYEGYQKFPMLFPFELILFLYAVFWVTKDKNLQKDQFVRMSFLFAIALGLFLLSTVPVMHPIRLLSISVALRLFMLSVITKKLWRI